MKNLLIAVVSLLLFSQTAAADDKSEIDNLLKTNLDAVFTILQKNDLDQQAKNKEIIDIVTPMFDFELMARLSLGKKHWSGLSQDKKERFIELFIKRLKASFTLPRIKKFDAQLIAKKAIKYDKISQGPKKITRKSLEKILRNFVK